MLDFLNILLFLLVVVIYIHVYNYYKVNNEIDFVELYEPLKTDYEKICNTKMPFTVLFGSKERFDEGKNALAPPLLYETESNNVYIDPKTNETPLYCESSMRNIIFVKDDNIEAKLFPPKTGEYLEKMDANNSVWDSTFMENIKHLKVELRKNSILVIPPFWYYSLRVNKKIENEKRENEKRENQENAQIKEESKIIIERCFYITYPNLLAQYFETSRDYIQTTINKFIK